MQPLLERASRNVCHSWMATGTPFLAQPVEEIEEHVAIPYWL